MKVFRILMAWWYWVTNRNNWLSKERLQHCAYCEFRKWFVCGECGCPLQAKSRLMEEECPKGKWPKYYLMFKKSIMQEP